MQPKIFFHKLVSLAMGLGLALSCGTVSQAASHREAPLIAQDPAADITDVYAFRSWEDPSKVVFIMNVIPAQEPSSGPNYFFFDDKVAYDFNLDIDQDGVAEDIIYRVQFKTQIRPPFDDLPVAYAGLDNPPEGLPPAITDLDGDGATGLGLRQTYTVTKIQGKKRTVLAKGLFAVPSNIGPRTMPDYEGLADKGIFSLSNGGRVFAGQRDETFYIDLGATFDTLNFRAPPILSDPQDANDGVNPFGNDMFSGFNVNTIALEIPISELSTSTLIGMYASTSRPKTEIHKTNGTVKGAGDFVQVARMGNPLVNELIIGTGMKDRWNASDPKNEAQFLDFYLNPRLVAVINVAFNIVPPFPTSNRTDLVQALLKYKGQDPTVCTNANRCSELLRLDTTVDPTDPQDQKRLGGLAGDAAGFPNGRRPNDDVTDIVLRVAAGILFGPVVPNPSVPNLGDGVNFNIGAPGTNVTANGIYIRFPFLPTPFDGRNRRHIDCGETGANPC